MLHAYRENVLPEAGLGLRRYPGADVRRVVDSTTRSPRQLITTREKDVRPSAAGLVVERELRLQIVVAGVGIGLDCYADIRVRLLEGLDRRLARRVSEDRDVRGFRAGRASECRLPGKTESDG